MVCSEKCEDAAQDWTKYKEFAFKNDERRITAVTVAHEFFIKALAFAGSDINKLRLILDSKQQFSVFDFDFSDVNDSQRNFKLLQAFCGLHTLKKSDEQLRKFYQIAAEALEDPNFEDLLAKKKDREDMIDFVCLLMLIADSNHRLFGHKKFNNNQVILEKSGDVGFFPFHSLFNHSCDANAVQVAVDNKLAVVVLRPIPAGSQVFVTYQQ
jgi:hypothetical protein